MFRKWHVFYLIALAVGLSFVAGYIFSLYNGEVVKRDKWYTYSQAEDVGRLICNRLSLGHNNQNFRRDQYRPEYVNFKGRLASKFEDFFVTKTNAQSLDIYNKNIKVGVILVNDLLPDVSMGVKYNAIAAGPNNVYVEAGYSSIGGTIDSSLYNFTLDEKKLNTISDNIPSYIYFSADNKSLIALEGGASDGRSNDRINNIVVLNTSDGSLKRYEQLILCRGIENVGNYPCEIIPFELKDNKYISVCGAEGNPQHGKIYELGDSARPVNLSNYEIDMASFFKPYYFWDDVQALF